MVLSGASGASSFDFAEWRHILSPNTPKKGHLEDTQLLPLAANPQDRKLQAQDATIMMRAEWGC
jgi:hypothetical protein